MSAGAVLPPQLNELEGSHSASARKPGQSIVLMQLCSFWCLNCGIQSYTEYLKSAWKWPFNCLFLRLLGFCWKSLLAQSRISYLKLAVCQSDSEGSVRCRDLVLNVTIYAVQRRACGSGAALPSPQNSSELSCLLSAGKVLLHTGGTWF